MTVFAVIPTHNRKEILHQTIRAFTAQTVPVTIVVGDGGSTDGTREMLALDFPEVIVCLGGDDLWWTGATNLALHEALRRSAPHDHILCINDDVLVRPDYVENLLVHAKEDRRIVGSIIVPVAQPDVIDDGGVRINWWSAASQVLNSGRKLSDFSATHCEKVSVLPGRGALYPVSAFRRIGLFPEKALPHYCADYAFSACCARAGYELVVVYGAVVLSRTELTGVHAPSTRLSFKELKRYFGSRRSSGNLRDRFYFAWIARHNLAQAALFFAFSVARLTAHYTGLKLRQDQA
jgi:GT2 family glycosyltransferase